jgi:starch phosphorylase
MRLLVDEHGMGWDKAWRITVNTFAYQTIRFFRALERWPRIFGDSCPAPEIIFEINRGSSMK